MSINEEEVLKKWRPGTQEIESYFIKYTINEGRFGIYVTAVNVRDAREQILKLAPNAIDIDIKQQMPTDEHIQQMRENDR